MRFMNLIERALVGLEEMIRVVEKQDYNAFLSLLSTRIRDKVDGDSFQDAMRQHSTHPLSRAIIDITTSKVLSEDPPAVKLMLKNGRTLCTLIKDGEKWVADNIFWR